MATPPACCLCWEPSGLVAYLHCPHWHQLYVTPPPDASVGNEVGRLTPSLFWALGALKPIQRCATGVVKTALNIHLTRAPTLVPR